MNGNEKRFFLKDKKENPRHEDAQYLKLYRSLARQKSEYNEDDLKAQVSTGQFSYLKNYLYQQLLDSLFSYHSETTPDLFVLKQLSIARILFKKNLYAQCMKVLNRAEKEAEKREMFTQLLDIIRWQLNVIKKEGFTPENLRKSRQLLHHNKKVLDLLNNVEEYRHLHHQMHTFSSMYGRLGSSDILAQCDQLISSPLLQNKNKALSQTAKYFYHITNAVYLRLKGDNKAAFNHDQRNVSLFSSQPELINTHPDAYITSLNNCVVSSILLKDFGLAEQYIHILKESEPIRQVLKHSEFSRYNLFLYTTVHELDICIHTGQFGRGDQLIKKSRKKIKKYNAEVNSPNIFFIYYNAACIYFGMGKFKEALKWLNKIEINNLKGIMLHVYSYERILSLITHYELGNMHLITYRGHSVINFLKSKNYEHKAAFITIKYLKTLAEKDIELNRKDKQELFKELRQRLYQLKKDKKQASAFDYFDYLTWVESKIQKESFAEITRQKWKRKAG